MNKRSLCLVLAGALAAMLCGCGGESAPTPGIDPTAGPGDVAVGAPSAPPAEVSGAVDPERPPAGEGEALPSATPAPTDEPAAPSAPAPTVDPIPSAEPTPEPTPGEVDAPVDAPADVTAADVRAAVSAAAGVSYDDATAYVDAFYPTLGGGDVVECAFSMPAMSTQIEELFVARVNGGQMETVKAACRDRQAAMAEDAAFYGSTGQYVDGYQLVSEGDWLLFYVGPNADAAVRAFREAVK